MGMLHRPTTLRFAGQLHHLGERPLLMGIVNVTPDSFSDGGSFFDPVAAIAHGEALVADGADWLDIGGESTRPGAEPVDEAEERRRVLPVIEGLRQRVNVPIAVDTYKAGVAAAAIGVGASIINDVTGFRDPAMRQVAAGADVACIHMHMRGMPTNMAELAVYDDVVREVAFDFAAGLRRLADDGVPLERVVLDPGIGFAKRTIHGLTLLNRLAEFHVFGRPILIGASRKRLVGEITGRPAHDRLAGTIASALACARRGAHILRVHDVAPVRDALAVHAAIDEGALARASATITSP